MIVTLEEVKHNLRLETTEDDAMLEDLIDTAEHLVMDILRVSEAEELTPVSTAKMAVLFGASFLYENRADPNYNRLNLTLRALLFADRGDAF